MRKRTLAVAAAFAASSFGAYAQAPAPKSIKMQSTWPASITLQEHFTLFAGRVATLTNGSVKIDAMAAGQIVPPSSAGRDQQEGDRRLARQSPTTGSARARPPRCSPRPRRALRHGPQGLPRLLYVGGGLEMWRDFYLNELS